MNWRFTFLFGLIYLLFSCNNHQKESAINKTSGKKNPLNCYRYINNKDTIILKVVDVNGFMTGTLVYNFYEKDKNMGTIQGEIKDETLFADYSFSSEGVQSVRPVAFKKEGEDLLEGYGETENQNGKLRFKNIESLDFTHSIKLRPFDCEK
ncbi:MAG TPA: hypothetical protein VGP55_04920 [Chitinophagaceae bacterium]|nr:hypothetical protein [Chitinophagaceae bacterium]